MSSLAWYLNPAKTVKCTEFGWNHFLIFHCCSSTAYSKVMNQTRCVYLFSLLEIIEMKFRRTKQMTVDSVTQSHGTGTMYTIFIMIQHYRRPLPDKPNECVDCFAHQMFSVTWFFELVVYFYWWTNLYIKISDSVRCEIAEIRSSLAQNNSLHVYNKSHKFTKIRNAPSHFPSRLATGYFECIDAD